MTERGERGSLHQQWGKESNSFNRGRHNLNRRSLIIKEKWFFITRLSIRGNWDLMPFHFATRQSFSHLSRFSVTPPQKRTCFHFPLFTNSKDTFNDEGLYIRVAMGVSFGGYIVNVGEEGAHQLFDRWVNLLDKYLETSGIGNSFSGASGFPIASDWEIIDWRWKVTWLDNVILCLVLPTAASLL